MCSKEGTRPSGPTYRPQPSVCSSLRSFTALFFSKTADGVLHNGKTEHGPRSSQLVNCVVLCIVCVDCVVLCIACV